MDKIKVRLLFVLLVPIFSYGGIYESTPHETQNQISEPPFLSVCDRTPQVRDKIMEIASEISDAIECSDDDALSLIISSVEYFDIGNRALIPVSNWFADSDTLKVGDFSGFSSLKSLSLFRKGFTTLPTGVFAGLGDSLEYLNLAENNLTTLPQGIFSGLYSLKELNLYDNNLTTLPQNVFSGLSSIEKINLYENPLDNLPLWLDKGLPIVKSDWKNSNVKSGWQRHKPNNN